MEIVQLLAFLHVCYEPGAGQLFVKPPVFVTCENASFMVRQLSPLLIGFVKKLPAVETAGKRLRSCYEKSQKRDTVKDIICFLNNEMSIPFFTGNTPGEASP